MVRAPPYHFGPPLRVPFTKGDAVDRTRSSGAFLDALLEPVDGYLSLDLHNLYCQMHNYELGPEILKSYPLDRVRVLHVSGGSFSQPTDSPAGKLFRRDTHDTEVPRQVFALLPRRSLHVPTSRSSCSND